MSDKLNNIARRPIQDAQNKINLNRVNPNVNFSDVLDKTIKETSSEGIKISNHARQRMSERNINLEAKDMQSLEEAMESLDKKGAKESLMIYKDLALIASIKNRTIITAMGTDDMDIVTNIDSTMIVK